MALLLFSTLFYSRCPRYSSIPAQCTMVADPANVCCQKPYCTYIPPTLAPNVTPAPNPLNTPVPNPNPTQAPIPGVQTPSPNPTMAPAPRSKF